jgi:hypothetical protein
MPRAPARTDRGAVTVEAAIALCALVTVFGFLCSGVMAVYGEIKCVDAAAEAARLISRGQPQLAADLVRSLAPSGARLAVQDAGDTIEVEVLAAAGGLLPGVELEGQAFAFHEPSAGGGHAG